MQKSGKLVKRNTEKALLLLAVCKTQILTFSTAHLSISTLLSSVFNKKKIGVRYEFWLCHKSSKLQSAIYCFSAASFSSDYRRQNSTFTCKFLLILVALQGIFLYVMLILCVTYIYMQTIKLMFVKLQCNAFVDCGSGMHLSTVYTLDCVQYTVTVVLISCQGECCFIQMMVQYFMSRFYTLSAAFLRDVSQ